MKMVVLLVVCGEAINATKMKVDYSTACLKCLFSWSISYDISFSRVSTCPRLQPRKRITLATSSSIRTALTLVTVVEIKTAISESAIQQT